MDAIAWPTAFVITVVLLRRQIRALLERRITVRRGGTSVEFDAAAALEDAARVATELLTPVELGDDSESKAATVEVRRHLVENMMQAGVRAGWAASGARVEDAPRPRIDWTAEGKALIKGDLATDSEWQMTKARLLVRLEDLNLTDLESQRLIEVVSAEREKARKRSTL
jgi:hypothetical protein